MADDYYKTLGVKRDASQADIQKAYRDLARKYHPDLHPDDKTAKKKFQEVQAAFDVLNDTSKRELYDRYGSSFESMGSGQPRRGGPRTGPASGGGGEDFDFSQFFGERFGAEGGGFADIFGQFTRGAGEGQPRGRRGPRTRTGGDVRHELEVPFLTAVNGGEIEITLQQPDGRSENLVVKIPAGIDEGKTIRLRGKGEPGLSGGPAGDLLITIHVQPHHYFQRTGNDLLVRVPVSLAEAALGAQVDVPTPRGRVSMRIPAGTSSGRKLRIKGQGVKAGQADAGDLLAEVQIVLPKAFDEESQELIRKLDQLNPLDPRSGAPW